MKQLALRAALAFILGALPLRDVCDNSLVVKHLANLIPHHVRILGDPGYAAVLTANLGLKIENLTFLFDRLAKGNAPSGIDIELRSDVGNAFDQFLAGLVAIETSQGGIRT